MLLFDTTFSSPLPVPLRIGDIDLDGFPDLVPIVVRQDGSVTPYVLLSHPCSTGANGCSGSFGRSFGVLSKDTDALTKIKDARGVAFLDIDEDVRVLAYGYGYLRLLICMSFTGYLGYHGPEDR